MIIRIYLVGWTFTDHHFNVIGNVTEWYSFLVINTSLSFLLRWWFWLHTLFKRTVCFQAGILSAQRYLKQFIFLCLWFDILDVFEWFTFSHKGISVKNVWIFLPFWLLPFIIALHWALADFRLNWRQWIFCFLFLKRLRRWLQLSSIAFYNLYFLTYVKSWSRFRQILVLSTLLCFNHSGQWLIALCLDGRLISDSALTNLVIFLSDFNDSWGIILSTVLLLNLKIPQLLCFILWVQWGCHLTAWTHLRLELKIVTCTRWSYGINQWLCLLLMKTLIVTFEALLLFKHRFFVLS